jgi:TolB-like protein
LIVEELGSVSIAVLPFVNRSSDPEQEYFSDGISEELLNRLAKIPQFRVAGRTSSFAFKGKDEELQTIGENLGVGSILEGSVRKSGERVRITAQLINVNDGFQLWSDTYDRELTDIFGVQDEIGSAVANGLKVTLLGDTSDESEPFYPVNECVLTRPLLFKQIWAG